MLRFHFFASKATSITDGQVDGEMDMTYSATKTVNGHMRRRCLGYLHAEAHPDRSIIL